MACEHDFPAITSCNLRSELHDLHVLSAHVNVNSLLQYSIAVLIAS